jgi:hypothetical protein
MAEGFWALTPAQGILSPGGVAAGSFAGFFGIAAARPPARTRTAAGVSGICRRRPLHFAVLGLLTSRYVMIKG